MMGVLSCNARVVFIKGGLLYNLRSSKPIASRPKTTTLDVDVALAYITNPNIGCLHVRDQVCQYFMFFPNIVLGSYD